MLNQFTFSATFSFKNFFWISFLLLFLHFKISAQRTQTCNFNSYLELKPGTKLSACFEISGQNVSKTSSLIESTLTKMGLKTNFFLRSCEKDLPHLSFLTIDAQEEHMYRFIVYPFLESDEYFSISEGHIAKLIQLGHAIGHHLNQHVLYYGLDHSQNELKADEFSGFFLANMGISLGKCLKNISDKLLSKTHPEKDSRIKAFTEGWEKFSSKSSQYVIHKEIAVFPYDSLQQMQLIERAEKAIESSNYDTAANLYLKTFQYSEGNNRDALYTSASSFMRAKKNKEALKCQLELLKYGIQFLDFDNRVLLFKNIGLLYQLENKPKKALEYFKVAERLDPDDVEVLNQQATILYKLGKKIAFIEATKKALKLTPDNADLYYNLGVVHEELQKTGKAIIYYKRALILNSNYVTARINLSSVYVKEGNDLADIMNSLSSSREDIIEYRKINKAKDRLFLKAIDILEDGLELNPKDKSLSNQVKNLQKTLGGKNEVSRLRKNMKKRE